MTVLETVNPSEKVNLTVSTFPFKIGRENCDLDLAGDRHVSRQHLLIELRGDGFYVTDLGSANGTVFDKKRMAKNEAIKLPDNKPTVLRLGTVTQLRLEPMP